MLFAYQLSTIEFANSGDPNRNTFISGYYTSWNLKEIYSIGMFNSSFLVLNHDYLVPFGTVTGAYLSYLLSHRPDLSSLLTSPPESFPSISQSSTLSNRLSTNIPAGSSSNTSLSVAVRFFIRDSTISGYLLVPQLIKINGLELEEIRKGDKAKNIQNVIDYSE